MLAETTSSQEGVSMVISCRRKK